MLNGVQILEPAYNEKPEEFIDVLLNFKAIDVEAKGIYKMVELNNNMFDTKEEFLEYYKVEAFKKLGENSKKEQTRQGNVDRAVQFAYAELSVYDKEPMLKSFKDSLESTCVEVVNWFSTYIEYINYYKKQQELDKLDFIINWLDDYGYKNIQELHPEDNINDIYGNIILAMKDINKSNIDTIAEDIIGLSVTYFKSGNIPSRMQFLYTTFSAKTKDIFKNSGTTRI